MLPASNSLLINVFLNIISENRHRRNLQSAADDCRNMLRKAAFGSSFSSFLDIKQRIFCSHIWRPMANRHLSHLWMAPIWSGSRLQIDKIMPCHGAPGFHSEMAERIRKYCRSLLKTTTTPLPHPYLIR